VAKVSVTISRSSVRKDKDNTVIAPIQHLPPVHQPRFLLGRQIRVEREDADAIGLGAVLQDRVGGGEGEGSVRALPVRPEGDALRRLREAVAVLFPDDQLHENLLRF
jgi:hypothetical protein